jgi:hypothetical protein
MRFSLAIHTAGELQSTKEENKSKTSPMTDERDTGYLLEIGGLSSILGYRDRMMKGVTPTAAW